jgi:hypothetical protein
MIIEDSQCGCYLGDRNTWTLFQDQKWYWNEMKWYCSDNNQINQTMAQNIKSLNEQNLDNVQYKTIRPSYKWGSGESQVGVYMKATWDYQDQVHSDQMVLMIVREGGWTTWAIAKSNSKGLSGSSPLKSDSSHDGQAGRLDCVSGGQKTLKVR